MTMGAKQIQIADAQLRIVLPGSWIRIPLRDEAETTAFVKRLLKRRVGTDDRLARMRRQFQEELVGTAREAVKAGVHTYLMSMEILPGIPFPGALLMFDIDWPEGALPALQEKGVSEAMTTGFPGVELVEGHAGLIGRRYEIVEQRLGENGQNILTMRLEYFLPYPYPEVQKLLAVRVNVPDIPHAEPFALLFNEIVDSITFPEDPSREHQESGPGRETVG